MRLGGVVSNKDDERLYFAAVGKNEHMMCLEICHLLSISSSPKLSFGGCRSFGVSISSSLSHASSHYLDGCRLFGCGVLCSCDIVIDTP